SPRGTSPQHWPAPAERISPMAVRRDPLWIGQEGLEAKVARDSGRELYSDPSPGPRRFLGPWTECSLRPLSPSPGGGTGPPRSRCGCRPGRTVLSAPQLRPAARARSGPRKRRKGQWRCRLPTRPVLKHGPRSLTRTRVRGLEETPWRNESEGRHAPVRWDPGPPVAWAHHRPVSPAPSGRWSMSVCDRTRKMVNYASHTPTVGWECARTPTPA
ncbi:hypothetical protein GOODEAATRI_032631, partial [Goodea atripinnis]